MNNRSRKYLGKDLKRNMDIFHLGTLDIPCDEEKIRQTIEASQAAFAVCEREYAVSRMEFLYQQGRYIKKYWWLLQALLLMSLCGALQVLESDFYIRRSIGVAAPVFVILMFPELWKNRSSNSMEIEGTTFYSLQQIYAARMTLFAGVDLIIITLFFIGALFTGKLTLWEMVIQFFLPFNVACCICFNCLYSKKIGSQVFSVFLCAVWTGLWELVVLNDGFYEKISGPVWGLMLAASFICVAYSFYRGQWKWNENLEVDTLWS